MITRIQTNQIKTIVFICFFRVEIESGTFLFREEIVDLDATFIIVRPNSKFDLSKRFLIFFV